MSARPILRWPNRMLRTPAAPVEAVTDEIRAIWQDMIDTMEAMPGVGLAAPQIGVGLRLCVVDASDERGWAVRMANPEIVSRSEAMNRHPEASPCLPGVSAEVERPAEVTVRYLGEDGAVQDRAFSGLWATSVQHQIDHLDGKLYIERLSRTKRDMVLKRAKKVAS
ncbi:peptide deformylase [Ovoidimarina sediminis]|uniref:peptide deformylase n=1 Tax=Ovoidimarina sediminis TaxID=3079856 RepID=UPI002907FEE0|nr:peptide deformylase [Rhodophyticola sp. MJ-SS7]MDU8943984.1 peptide deformylase [Rhodophyticola sp. MJ-SS7]